MKKILLFLLVPWVVFAGRDTIIASGKWNVNTTWSAGSPPGVSDTVYRGNFNDTLNANYTIKSYVSETGKTGAHIRNGYKLTITGSGISYTDDGTGVRDYGIGLYITGDDALVSISSALGTVTATSCTLSIAGNRDSIFHNKAIIWNQLKVAPTDTIAINSAGAMTMTSANTPLVVETNCRVKFYNNQNFNRSTTGMLANIGSGTTFLLGNTQFRVAASGIKDTFPGIIASSISNGLYIQTSAAFAQPCSLYISGKINIGNSAASILNVTDANNTSSSIFFEGDSVICNTIKLRGLNTPGYTKNVFAGSTKFIITTFSSVSTTATNEYLYWQNAKIFYTGSLSYWVTLNVDPGFSSWTLTSSGGQTITSSGKQFYDLTVNNSGTATIKYIDSLSLLGDFYAQNGRDSIGRLSCVDYTNSTDDSVFHYDTTIITGNYYRNNAKVSRVGGIVSFRGTTAGKMGPLCVRRPGKKMTALSDIRASRVLDTLGALKMGTYALACTTLTVRDTGLQCAAVILDTLNSYKGGTIGGGSVGRWNWLTDGLKYVNASATTLNITSVSGLGGSVGLLDTLTATAACSLAFAGTQTVTASYVYAKNIRLQAEDSLILTDGTSINGGGNSGNIKFPPLGPILDSLVLNRGTVGDSVRAYVSNAKPGFDTMWVGTTKLTYNNHITYYTIFMPAGIGVVNVIVGDTAHPQNRDTLPFYYDTIATLVSSSPATGNFRHSTLCSLTTTEGTHIDTVWVGDSLCVITSKANALVVITVRPAIAVRGPVDIRTRGQYGYRDTLPSAWSWVNRDTTPRIDSIRPIWQKRGALFKVRGFGFHDTKGSGTVTLNGTNLGLSQTWTDVLIIDTIPMGWTPKGTFNLIISNSNDLKDTTQLRVLIPTITGMDP
jgi:hypothetical protein